MVSEGFSAPHVYRLNVDVGPDRGRGLVSSHVPLYGSNNRASSSDFFHLFSYDLQFVWIGKDAP